MKILIVIFLILLAFVGFQFVSFIQDEVSEAIDTSIYEFSDSEPTEISSGTKSIIEDAMSHRLSTFTYETASFFKEVTSKSVPFSDTNDFYVSVFYNLEGKLVQEDFLVSEDDFNLELTNKVAGDLLVSLPVGNPLYGWCASDTNMNHKNYTTYVQNLLNKPETDSSNVICGGDPYQQQLYLIEPDSTGYYKITFKYLHPSTTERSDDVDVLTAVLEFEIIDIKE